MNGDADPSLTRLAAIRGKAKSKCVPMERTYVSKQQSVRRKQVCADGRDMYGVEDGKEEAGSEQAR